MWQARNTANNWLRFRDQILPCLTGVEGGYQCTYRGLSNNNNEKSALKVLRLEIEEKANQSASPLYRQVKFQTVSIF